jgi:hypothetical protein
MSHAQDAYKSAMLENIQALDTVTDVPTLTGIASAFAAMYDAKKEWQPLYYECLGYIRLSTVLSGTVQKKQAIDKAAVLLDSLPAENDEAQVLRAWFAMQYMAIDRSTWQTYYPMLSNALEKAKNLNAANPRIYYLQGIIKYNMPSGMGGGKEEGLKLFEQSIQKFNAYKPIDVFAPTWGRKEAEEYLRK